ncbi:MAG: hypothetical protein SFY32_09090 [Bacteroidota bacterium]|nr:hypothetical protein [Bacteroidota bacterium]
MKTQEELLVECKRLVEQKFAQGDAHLWKNEHYLALSKDIQEVTKIYISADTLKRIFGKRKFALPQPATRNALVAYIGYKDWVEFSKSYNLHYSVDTLPTHSSTRFNLNWNKLGFPFLILVLTIIGTYFFIYPNLKGNIQLTVTNTQGKAPLYTHFRFQSEGLFLPDSFTLMLGYNDWLFPHPVSKITLPSTVKEFNESYQAPDYHKVKLIAAGKTIDSAYVYPTADKWLALAGYPFSYFEIVDFKKQNGYITIDTNYLRELQYTEIKHYITEFRYFNPMKINGDALEGEATIELNEHTGGKSCFDAYFDVVCERGNISLQFLQPGCEKFSHFELSEVKLDGRYTDLSVFGIDFNQPRTIKMKSQNNVLFTYLDNQLIHQHTYKQALGQVKGIRIKFKGIGKLYQIKLKDINSGEVYEEGFE